MITITREYVEHQLATSKLHLKNAEAKYNQYVKEKQPVGCIKYLEVYISKIKKDIKFWESYLEG